MRVFQGMGTPIVNKDKEKAVKWKLSLRALIGITSCRTLSDCQRHLEVNLRYPGHCNNHTGTLGPEH